MPTRPKLHTYEGRDVVVYYDLGRCIHAAECTHGLPRVFDTASRPWVQPDEASADEVADVVMRCPTGALTYERKDGGPPETVPEPNAVVVERDGPLLLRGDLVLEDPYGEVLLETTRMALCRCGHTRATPFCDGSHAESGFTDPARIVAVTSEAINQTPTDGRVFVVAKPSGPMLLRGSFDVEGEVGKIAFREGRGAFCRCGHSKNKPLCDGSHKEAGFRAP